MQINVRTIGAGVAAAVAAGFGYAMLSRHDHAAAFATVEREGAFSVRDYPRLLVAETVVPGPRRSALSLGFAALTDYLAGKARAPIAVPVLADGDEDGRGWRTRLVISERLGVDALPAPREGVSLRALPPRRLAALRFAGAGDDGALDAHEAELRAWMEDRGLSAAGPVEHAFYNSPFTPAPLRRNEVLIPLAA
jgi:hypothetical protein